LQTAVDVAVAVAGVEVVAAAFVVACLQQRSLLLGGLEDETAAK